MLGVNDGRTLGAGSECMKALNFVRFCQFLFLRLGHFAVPATLYGSVALLISSPASAITFPNLYSLGLWHAVSETGQPQSAVSILCFHKIVLQTRTLLSHIVQGDNTDLRKINMLTKK